MPSASLTVIELLERDDLLSVIARPRGAHRAPTHTARNMAVIGLAAGIAGSTFAPGVANAQVSGPVGSPAPVPAVEVSNVSEYRVVPGDSLSKIGGKLGLAWRDIAAANGIASPYRIYVGQVLKLPGSGTAVKPVSNVTPAPAGKAATAVAFAMAQLNEGDRYVYGANGPNTWDCSSLTQAAWRAAGVNIPRTSALQRSAGVATTRAALVPGDLVLWSGHVAMYIGNGKIVHAVNANTGLKVTTIEWMGRTPIAYRHIG